MQIFKNERLPMGDRFFVYGVLKLIVLVDTMKASVNSTIYKLYIIFFDTKRKKRALVIRVDIECHILMAINDYLL